MRKILIGVFALMLVLPVAVGVWAQEPAAKGKVEAEPASWKTETMSDETATVVAVDQKTRVVTLRKADGKEGTFKAGKDIQNLALVEPGDQIRFAHYTALQVRVLKKGETPQVTGAGGAVLRQVDEGKPGGLAVREKTAVLTIEALDKKAMTATLKGEDGKTITVTPRDPKRMDQVKVGDRLEVTATEEVAIKVRKVEKK